MKLNKVIYAAVAYTIFRRPDVYDFFEQNVFIPVSSSLSAEYAHQLALWSIRLRLPPYDHYSKPASLRTTVFGQTFDNPIGLAAGFDKDCEAINGLKRLGFGFIEVGSITPKPQEGNPSPRVFRLPEDKALINRYGFPSKGVDAAVKNFRSSQARITAQIHDQSGVPGQPGFHKLPNENEDEISFEYNRPEDSDRVSRFIMHLLGQIFLYFFQANTCKVGINLGINKTTKNPTNDYCEGVRKLGEFSDYMVINVSSPNTPGLRDLQCKQKLERMLGHISSRIKRQEKVTRHKISLLLKISPDLDEQLLDEVIDVTMDSKFGIDGLIVSNTTIARPKSLKNSNRDETGGLSGCPLKQRSTEMIRKVYVKTQGTIPIIGVGGIDSAEDAYEKIRAGASLVQLYTSLVYNGFGSIRRMKSELCELLKKDGYKNVQLAVGADVPEVRNQTLMDLHSIYHLPLISREVLDSMMKSPIDSSNLIQIEGESKQVSDRDEDGVESED